MAQLVNSELHLKLEEHGADLAIFPRYIETQQTEFVLRRGMFGYALSTTQKQVVLQTKRTGFGHRYREFKDAQCNNLFELHRHRRWHRNAFSGWDAKQDKLFTIDGTYKCEFKYRTVNYYSPNIITSSCRYL